MTTKVLEPDPELNELLGALRKDGPYLGTEVGEAPPPDIKPPIIEPFLKTPAPSPPVSKSGLVKPDDPPIDDLGFKRLINKFGTSVDLIISNQSADRAQAETTFSFLDSVIRARISNGQPVGESLVEAWIKCLQIKADVNANAVGSLDAISKLLAASKKNDLVVNVGAAIDSSGIDLERLLSEPYNSDEFKINE